MSNKGFFVVLFSLFLVLGMGCRKKETVGCTNCIYVPPVDSIDPTEVPFLLQTQSEIGQITLTWQGTYVDSVNISVSTDATCTDWGPTSACADFKQFPATSEKLVIFDTDNLPGFTTVKQYFFHVEANTNEGDTTPLLAAGRVYAPQPNNTVKTIAQVANERIYLGGTFTSIGIGGGAGVTINPRGALVGGLAWINGVVNTAVSDGQGGQYVGGTITSVEGHAVGNIAHIDALGVLNTSWNIGVTNSSGTPAIVKSLTLSADAKTLYVTGMFDEITLGGNTTLPTNGIFAVNTDLSAGTNSVVWNPTDLQANGANPVSVNALAFDAEGTIYLGGQFSANSSGVVYSNAAAYAKNAAGTFALNGWNPKVTRMSDADLPTINALLVSGSTVFIGGIFDKVQYGTGPAVEAQNLAGVGTTASAVIWAPQVTASGFRAAVNALTVSENSEGSTLYVAGAFDTVNDTSTTAVRTGIASFKLSQTAQPTLNNWNLTVTSVTGTPQVNAVAVSDNLVYLGGVFGLVGPAGQALQERNQFAIVTADTPRVVADWDANFEGNSANGVAQGVNTISLNNDGTAFVGGDVWSLKGQDRYLIAVIEDGKLSDIVLDVLGVAGASVNTLTVSQLNPNWLYVGGQYDFFKDATGVLQSRPSMAVVDTTMNLLNPWSPAKDEFQVPYNGELDSFPPQVCPLPPNNNSSDWYITALAGPITVHAFTEFKSTNPGAGHRLQVGGSFTHTEARSFYWTLANMLSFSILETSDLIQDAIDSNFQGIFDGPVTTAISEDFDTSYMFYSSGPFAHMCMGQPTNINAFSTYSRNQLVKTYQGGGGPYIMPWDAQMNTGGLVNTLAMGTYAAAPVLYVGGENITNFSGSGTIQNGSNLTALSTGTGSTTSNDASVVFNFKVTGAVNALASSNTAIYAGGKFTAVDTNSVAGLVSLSNTTGAISTGWASPKVEGGAQGVEDLVILSQGDLWVAGDFMGLTPATSHAPLPVRYVRFLDAVDATTGAIK